MKTRIEKIKKHVVDNKEVYIAVAVTAVTTAAITIWVVP